MITDHDDPTIAALFEGARTHNVWLDRDVPEDLPRQLYERLRWAPTSANTNPDAQTKTLRCRNTTMASSRMVGGDTCSRSRSWSSFGIGF